MKITMLALVSLALLDAGCKKQTVDGGAAGSGSAMVGSGSAAMGSRVDPAAPEVSCQVAAKKYTTLMAEGAGNELADSKPDGGTLAFVRVTIEEDCATDAWPRDARACIDKATASTALGACFADGGAGAKARLHAVIEEVKTRKAVNAARGSDAPGSGSAK